MGTQTETNSHPTENVSRESGRYLLETYFASLDAGGVFKPGHCQNGLM